MQELKALGHASRIGRRSGARYRKPTMSRRKKVPTYATA